MFLGIDCSTQSLKIIVINELKDCLAQVTVIYDSELSHYNTKNGVIRYYENGIEHISTPTHIFIEALELAFDKLSKIFNLSKIKGISGSGQQHGSVWWKKNSQSLLHKINNSEIDTANKNLCNILKDSFSINLSPMWMDNSTTVETIEITKQIGSSQKLADVTGSRAFERFTGPQIRYIFKNKYEIYENTERISLISSFIASLLIMNFAPIDFSDGCGMNLLNISTRSWDEQLLIATAPNLREKLGEPVHSASKIGFVSKFWSKKYGFSKDCEIFAFSGDNPCSLIGLGLNASGDIGISLGTSDVLFAVTNNPIPNADEGSILIHPEDENAYMLMLVYKNGDPARKYIRDHIHLNDNDWSKFDKCILNTQIGNSGNISFYYIETEITPNISKTGILKFDQNDELLKESTLNEYDCRGLIESKVLSYKYHAKLLGLDKINSIVVTGGSSVNMQILQIIADIFEIEVACSSLANTSASGAAIRSLNSYYKLRNLKPPINSTYRAIKAVVKPRPENFNIYRNLFVRFEKLERIASNKLNNNTKSFS